MYGTTHPWPTRCNGQANYSSRTKAHRADERGLAKQCLCKDCRNNRTPNKGGSVKGVGMENKIAILLAILAAALYAINVPLSKLLQEVGGVSPTMLAGFLYLGAGVGIACLLGVKKMCRMEVNEQWLTKRDLPYTLAMVVLDIVAPIALMFGIAHTHSANVSLLNNFEIVATSLIALMLFKEKISKRLWLAILLVVVASVILGFEGVDSFVFGKGSLFVILACICWGLENNCTRSISDKNSEEIVIVKGLCSGIGSVIVAFVIGEQVPSFLLIVAVMLLGFVAYGLSINFYIMAQKALGAAKTSAFYSVAPFLGVGFSFVLLGEKPALQFYIALVIMLISTWIMIKETLGKEKLYHGFMHTHKHKHGEITHTHEHRHYIYNPAHFFSHSHSDKSR